jgi:hypothetical protein
LCSRYHSTSPGRAESVLLFVLRNYSATTNLQSAILAHFRKDWLLVLRLTRSTQHAIPGRLSQ